MSDRVWTSDNALQFKGRIRLHTLVGRNAAQVTLSIEGAEGFVPLVMVVTPFTDALSPSEMVTGPTAAPPKEVGPTVYVAPDAVWRSARKE